MNPAMTETAADPTRVYFGKEIFSNPVLIGGAPVPFEQLDGNRGVIALVISDPLVTALNEVVGRFGVYKISAEEYAEKKSRYPFSGSVKKRPDMLTLNQAALAPMFKPRPQGQDTPAAAADKTGGFIPLEVPKPAPVLPAPTAEQAPPAETPPTKSNFKPATAKASQRVKESAPVEY
jgi:hypothetical protein